MVLSPFDLETLSLQYSQYSPDNIELKDFINFAISSKQLRFTLQDVSNKYPLLLASNLIGDDGVRMAGKNIGFKDDARIYYALFKGFASNFPYNFTGNITNLFEFYDKCFKLMEVDGKIWPAGLTMEKYRRFLIMTSFKAGHFDPIAQVNTLNKADSSYKNTMICYLENWQVWNYPFDKFWTTTGVFAEAIGLNKEGVLDFRWQAIYKALQQNLEIQPDTLGIKVLMESTIGPNTWGAMADYGLAVLSKNGQLPVSEVLLWLTDPHKTTSALVALLQDKTFTDQDAQQLYAHFSTASLDDRQTQLWYNLIVYLLEKATNLSPAVENQLQECLRKAIASGVESNGVAVVNALLGYHKNRGFCTQLIHQLIDEEPYHPHYNAVIAVYFFRINSLDGFFDFIYRYSFQKQSFKLTPFKNICESFFDKYPDDFVKRCIDLSIDDWGFVRKAGMRILNHLLHEHKGRGVTIKPGNYDALQQYKFIVAATSSPMLMEELIICLIPFLFVKSPIVIELAMSKLEVVVEDYKGEAMDKITPLLAQHPEKFLILQRLQATLDNYINKTNLSYQINEFDVRIAYPKQFRQFMLHHVKKSQDTMEKARKEHRGISAMIPITIIARGGGNLMPDGNVTPLNTFSAGYSLPARIFKDPVADELANFIFNTTNWTKEFEEWKQIILSSGNI